MLAFVIRWGPGIVRHTWTMRLYWYWIDEDWAYQSSISSLEKYTAVVRSLHLETEEAYIWILVFQWSMIIIVRKGKIALLINNNNSTGTVLRAPL